MRNTVRFLCCAGFLLLASASFFLWAAGPFAILKSGPDQRRAVPGFVEKNYRCLYGEYSFAASAARVWAVPSLLVFEHGWTSSQDAGNLYYNERERLFASVVALPPQPLARNFSVSWTLIFSFDAALSSEETAAFVRVFTQRFEYFAALAKGFEDISFPAILENEKK